MLYAAFFANDGTVRLSNSTTEQEICNFVAQFGQMPASCQADGYLRSIEKYFPKVYSLMKRSPGDWKVRYPCNHQSRKLGINVNDSARLVFCAADPNYKFHGNFVFFCTKG